MRLTFTILVLIISFGALADDLTIPNEFQPNTPARAADVNANFSAVEASVDDNAADIAANTSSIQANTNAINALPTSVGMPVYSADEIRVGRLIAVTHLQNGTLLMQSDTGYLFESDIIGDRHLMAASSYHAEPNCAGIMYTFIGMDWAATTGVVVRSMVDGQAYYWPRGSAPVQVTLLSQRHPDGSCQDGLSWTTIASAVIPNDESITGVPNIKPNWPLKIGP